MRVTLNLTLPQHHSLFHPRWVRAQWVRACAYGHMATIWSLHLNVYVVDSTLLGSGARSGGCRTGRRVVGIAAPRKQIDVSVLTDLSHNRPRCALCDEHDRRVGVAGDDGGHS